MPTLYRPMKAAEDNFPVVGSNSKELGVRVPPNPNSDIDLDDNQLIKLNGRGMSVAEHWQHLPGHLIPKRLQPIFPAATGSNSLKCFKMGEGNFEEANVNSDLRVVIKSGNSHGGNVAPLEQVEVDNFQSSLAATRNAWIVDEDLL